MVKTKSYESMSYEELEAEKRKISQQIVELKETARQLAQLMDKKHGELRLRRIANDLAPDEKAQLKDMLD
jgi:hypothetical protein